MVSNGGALSLLLVLVFLLGLCETICASDGAVTPRLKLFTIFSMDDDGRAAGIGSSKASSSSLSGAGTNNSAMAVDMDTVKAADSDFILLSTMIRSEAGAPPVTVAGYQSTDSKQILYQKEHWKLIQEGTFYEDVPFMWARFQSTAVDNATACLAVAQWDESWSESDDSELTTPKRAANLVVYVNGSCKAGDVVALVLTSPVPAGVVDYFEGKPAAGRMVEASHVLQQQQYLPSSSVTVSNLPSATSNRLFLRLQDAMCIDKAATPVTSAGLGSNLVAPWEALALELCSGSDCHVCKPSSLADGQSRPSTSASKHIVVIVLSCGAFIVASIALFFLLFRRYFFAPDESSKEEKEITTNLAYVLRI